MIDLSVVIPCYNEGRNIPAVVKRFRDCLPGGMKAELILVNNGSSDNSDKIIRGFVKRYSFIRTVKIKKNIGYGFGIFSGLKTARGRCVCWTHADMQTDPADTIRAYKIMIEQPHPEECLVKGIRIKRPIVDSVFAAFMSIVEAIILGGMIYDINAHPNLFHRSFMSKLKKPPHDFSFDLYVPYTAKMDKYRIVRFPVFFPRRRYGESHWNVGFLGRMKFIKMVVGFSLELKRRS